MEKSSTIGTETKIFLVVFIVLGILTIPYAWMFNIGLGGYIFTWLVAFTTYSIGYFAFPIAWEKS
jgi:hypothetical protein